MNVPSVISSTSPLSPKHLSTTISNHFHRKIMAWKRYLIPVSASEAARGLLAFYGSRNCVDQADSEDQGANSLCEFPGRCTWVPVHHFLSKATFLSVGRLQSKGRNSKSRAVDLERRIMRGSWGSDRDRSEAGVRCYPDMWLTAVDEDKVNK